MRNGKFKYLSVCKDFDVLKEQLSDKQLEVIETALSLYENDDILVEERGYEMIVEYRNEVQEFCPYKSIILWYQDILHTDDFIDYMNEVWGE